MAAAGSSAAMDRKIVDEINGELARITISESVAIPLAIESGSRAWGFPSPDSDYDCRFVFVRTVERTHTLFPARDVIEHPVTGLIDLNGWELSKALRLLHKGNAVIIEWLTSPFVYGVDEEFRSAFLRLAHDVAERRYIGAHYFHLADQQLRRNLADPNNAPLKKLFYALRPLMALRWLECHPNQAVAPMHFPTLCASADLKPQTAATISELLEAKAVTRELGTGRIPPLVREFLESEHLRASGLWSSPQPPDEDREKLVSIDEFWRYWVERLGIRRE